MRKPRVSLFCFAVFLCACDQAEMDRRNQESIKRWNEFWGGDSRQGSIFGPKAGDTELWTIECNDYEGANSREMADSMATALKSVEGIKGDAVRVEHGEGHSRVLYGSYPLKYVRAKVSSEEHVEGDVVIDLSEELKRDLRLVRSLALGEEYPFFSARPIPQPLKAVGPPAWDLRNAKGVYTLNVGVTYDTQQFHSHEEAAVEWVRTLREQGYEAYYCHAPDGTRTSICVGTFGEDALTPGPDGKTQYSEAVQALRNQGDFLYNLENGHKVYRTGTDTDTGEKKRMPNWSFLVKIPRTDVAGE
jgi:hypothetical protein